MRKNHPSRVHGVHKTTENVLVRSTFIPGVVQCVTASSAAASWGTEHWASEVDLVKHSSCGQMQKQAQSREEVVLVVMEVKVCIQKAAFHIYSFADLSGLF